uniref:Uncharacterized protein n=1 Tax=Candidatus Kentrum eta TaxID=2126337 RepID=A0A450VQ01_9GAMM|nr:MAG: hypothetical protein BECKH772B_GA0070898_107222 [Candidatus Kentron sp. H]VFK07421.1 MAG: hypothetical protein BECKH772A_GA0070896_107312 [Candidatus Kentron sp. H]VFK08214.1 MAG: hypothetical protein BECKH772A_GA0070896_108331 [Candidatus Kentron sp. H]VFK10891.1 MAG: hypothetical protein BECKH772C_GA0070978_107492 [Candidatus Kentron sp. H]VFK11717.1 MAG: hypothetical protein BECKH772C_GA0070978_108621 [Candidatus Kentron sp. H]
MSEVEVRVQGFGDAFVTSKLFAIIGSDSMYLFGQGFEQGQDCLFDLHRLPLFSAWRSVIDAIYVQ